MKWFLFIALTFIAVKPLYATDVYSPIAVIELFTSEGCSSCPPADMLLAKLAVASRENGIRVFPLSFHVDYWNYLGWRDPYSQKDFSNRQAWYASQLNDNTYTPQAVINGRYSVIGSDTKKVQGLINKSLREPASVDIQLKLVSVDEKKILAAFHLNGQWQKKNLAVALVERGLVSDVTRGENAGRKLLHENVVRQFKTLIPDNNEGSFIFQAPLLAHLEKYSLIAYVQDTVIPEILGASRLDLPAVQ